MADIDATTNAVLQDVVKALTEALARAQADNKALRTEVRRLVKMVEGLTGQLDQLLAEKDEERKAELARLREEAKEAAAKLAEAQVQGAPAQDAAEPKPDSEESRGTSPDGGAVGDSSSRPPGGGGKKPIPGHLDREKKRLRPDQCQKCGGTRLQDTGERIIEEWDYVRAHLRARRTHLVACDCEDCGATTTASEPPMPFDRATCTMAMLAWLLFAKCGLFLPLDRVCRDLELQGAPIPSPTLTRWFNRGADLLAPIWVATRAELLAESHIATDGTGLLVIHPRRKGEPPQKPHRGQILVFCNEEIAVYFYTPTKDGFHAEDFLTVREEDGEPVLWKGTITADAVSSQDILFLDGDRTEGGCNAHGFRKFRDDADKAPLLATAAMGFIDAMFIAEAQARERGLTEDALLAHRQEHAAPHAEKLRVWLGEHIEDLLPTNPVRKAMQYYINHWHALMLWLTDPAVPPDNNGSERALRHLALLRKNSLFAGGPEGAVRVCTVLTLVQTCRLIGVDPFEYLEWALTHIVPHPDNRGLAAVDLTPSAYKRAQQA